MAKPVLVNEFPEVILHGVLAYDIAKGHAAKLGVLPPGHKGAVIRQVTLRFLVSLRLGGKASQPFLIIFVTHENTRS